MGNVENGGLLSSSPTTTTATVTDDNEMDGASAAFHLLHSAGYFDDNYYYPSEDDFLDSEDSEYWLYQHGLDHGMESEDEEDEDSAETLEPGYDYEFVDEPSDEMRCPICLFVLREPNLTSCCGNHFCRSCISVIKKEGGACPLCQTDKFNVMLDKFFTRKVNELKTKCPHTKHGCKWTGELGSVQKHTDSECEHVEVTCKYSCGEHVARCHLASHETDHCPKRPFKCEHCGCQGSYRWISDVHWSYCDQYPVPCPNNCDVGTVKRQHLKQHKEKECPLECVECEFKCVGCSVSLPRKDMPDHVSENLGWHVAMIPKMYHEMTLKFQKKLDEKSQQIEELKSQVKSQKEELEAQKRQMNIHQREIRALKSSLNTTVPPVEFVMTNFEENRRENWQWFSHPFYSHANGYKMCLSVFANGVGKGRRTHVSVFVNMMRGDSDERQVWPFRGEVTIQLLSQKDKSGDIVEGTVRFDSRTPFRAAGRVFNSDVSYFGHGFPRFISHREVQDNGYLVDDCLQFRISSVATS